MRPTSRAHSPPQLTTCSATKGALVGDDVPGAVGAGLQIDDASEAVDLGAGEAGAFGIGLGDAPGIEVAFHGIEHRADEVFLVDERIHFRGFVDRQDLEVHAEIAAARARHLQPVEPLPRPGEIEAAGDVHAAGTPEIASISL